MATTRVTNVSTTLTFISQIFERREALDRTRAQVASGFRVEKPSDDPSRAATISQLQNTSKRLERHRERIASATGLLETQESVLNSVEQLLVRAREIGTQAANGTFSHETRESMSTEVFQLRDTLVSLANTKYQGVYLFAGAADTTAPFTASTYTNPSSSSDPANTRYVWTNATGSDQTRSIRVSDHDTVRITSSGEDIFSSAIAGLERLGRSLHGYRTTPEDLSTLPTGGGVAFNLPAEYGEQTSAILLATDAIESARHNDVVEERSSVGSRLNRILQAGELIDSVKVTTEQARATLQDIDIFEAASQLTALQTSLEGLLAAGNRINGLSLLDFIA